MLTLRAPHPINLVAGPVRHLLASVLTIAVGYALAVATFSSHGRVFAAGLLIAILGIGYMADVAWQLYCRSRLADANWRFYALVGAMLGAIGFTELFTADPTFWWYGIHQAAYRPATIHFVLGVSVLVALAAPAFAMMAEKLFPETADEIDEGF